MDDATYSALRAYLEKLGEAEGKAFRERRKPRKSDRFTPSEYHRELIAFLNKGDEEGFKALKQEQGRYSVLGH